MPEIPEAEGVTEVNLIANVTAKPDFVDDVVRAIKKLVEETRKEEGNIKFEPMQGVENVTTIIVVETWRSKQDLEHHFATKHFNDAMKEMEGKTESTVLTYLAKL